MVWLTVWVWFSLSIESVVVPLVGLWTHSRVEGLLGHCCDFLTDWLIKEATPT